MMASRSSGSRCPSPCAYAVIVSMPTVSSTHDRPERAAWSRSTLLGPRACRRSSSRRRFMTAWRRYACSAPGWRGSNASNRLNVWSRASWTRSSVSVRSRAHAGSRPPGETLQRPQMAREEALDRRLVALPRAREERDGRFDRSRRRWRIGHAPGLGHGGCCGDSSSPVRFRHPATLSPVRSYLVHGPTVAHDQHRLATGSREGPGGPRGPGAGER